MSGVLESTGGVECWRAQDEWSVREHRTTEGVEFWRVQELRRGGALSDNCTHYPPLISQFWQFLCIDTC